jgi:hypothetical protein
VTQVAEDVLQEFERDLLCLRSPFTGLSPPMTASSITARKA